MHWLSHVFMCLKKSLKGALWLHLLHRKHASWKDCWVGEKFDIFFVLTRTCQKTNPLQLFLSLFKNHRLSERPQMSTWPRAPWSWEASRPPTLTTVGIWRSPPSASPSTWSSASPSAIHVQIKVKRLLWGKFNNSGQICVAPDYILCSKVGEHWQLWGLTLSKLVLIFSTFYFLGDWREADSCDEESAARFLRREGRGVEGLLQNWWGGRTFCWGDLF